MIWLWIAAALISAALAVLIVQRSARAMQDGGRANPALAVYRRQMAELDELAERGVLGESERRSVRSETGRRLLAAAERPEGPVTTSGPRTILLAAAAVPLIAGALYLLIGAPQFADQPFKARLADWRRADPQTLVPPQMAAILRAIAAERPTDAEPLRQLAIAEFASRQPTEALQALHRAIALAPKRADLWALLAEAQVAEAQGEASADAVDAFRHVLALDPANANARYYFARWRIADGDVAGGLADWRALQASLPVNDPGRRALDTDIQTVVATGKLRPMMQGQSNSVGTPQIEAMVDGLAARLRANPDDPTGWVRLVRAYSVLGQADRRDDALARARARYARRPDVLTQLNAAAAPAARSAAVSPPAGSP